MRGEKEFTMNLQSMNLRSMNLRSIRSLLFAFVVLCMSAASFGQIGIAISIAPPALPVYEQPLCPGEGYIWTPGYWAYDYDINDYYWVPGTWVEAPQVGYLWTPAYWGWGGDSFLFHEGYWGPHVGFYGGISYGFGYFGFGYEGGRWDHDRFFYNRSVNNVNVTEIHNVYNTTVINNNVNHVSYNGGNGGINVRPRPEEERAQNERHIAPVAVQARHMQEARSNPQQRASVNMGRPAVAATARPGELRGNGVVAAREAGAPYHPPANRGGNEARSENRPANNNASRPNEARPETRTENNNANRPPMHARDLPAMQRPGNPPSTGNAKRDQKYQQQQDKVFAKQQQERAKLQQRQEQDHQRLTQQHANEQRQQQVEQRHQQQTQQLQQRHQQQQQHLQQKQQPRQQQPRSGNKK
jgi:hypothetical protein